MNTAPLKNHNAVIFDLDGTLIDSAPDVANALNKTLETIERPQLTLETVKTLIAHGSRNMIMGALAATGGPSENITAEQLIERYLNFYKAEPVKHTTVYSGVVDVLNRLRVNGQKIGICTNKSSLMTNIVLEALQLMPYFCGITTADNVEHTKPDGRHILETLKRMDASVDGAVMVGDSHTDIAAACDAGIGAVAVMYGYFAESIDQNLTYTKINHLTELPSALERLQA